jgi:hypothetical protein
MARIEQATDFFFITMQSCRQLDLTKMRLPEGTIQRRFGGSLGGKQDSVMVGSHWGGDRDGVVAPETPGNRFLKAICRLPECVRDVVPLGNGFWHIREGDHKASLLFLRSQGRGIDKGLHRVLLQVGEGQPKLREHRM